MVVVIFATATNAVPLTTRCMELLNSTGPYAYCDVVTNTAQGDDRLRGLVYMANNVTTTVLLIPVCKKEDNKEKVSMCNCINYKISIHCFVAALLIAHLLQAC